MDEKREAESQKYDVHIKAFLLPSTEYGTCELKSLVSTQRPADWIPFGSSSLCPFAHRSGALRIRTALARGVFFGKMGTQERANWRTLITRDIWVLSPSSSRLASGSREMDGDRGRQGIGQMGREDGWKRSNRLKWV